MSIRSRFARIALICLLVLLFAGYFTFSTFVFSPTESDYEPDVATLVPRDVDFFLAKSNLRKDFTKLPRLALQDKLEKTQAWATWTSSPEYAELDKQFGIEAQLDNLRQQLGALGVDPLKAFGGKDLALAGYVRGATFEQADWAAYGRCNWMGKLALAGLAHPKLIALEKRGFKAETSDELTTLSGGQLLRPLFLTRIRDVVVVGTSKDLVAKAHDLQARGGQESFGLAANYNDHILRAHRTTEGDDIELYCDWRTLAEKMRISGRFPDPQSEFPWVGMLARMFQLGSLRSIAGTIGFDQGVIVDAHADLSSEMITAFQKTLYRQRGRDSQQVVNQLARLAHPDSYAVVHLEAPLGEFLKEVYDSLDSATRMLLDDTLRSTGQFNNAAALIAELDTLFKGRIGLIARENDYPVKKDDPPHNEVPLPAITVMLWIEGGQKSYARLMELQRLVSDNQGKFALRGRDGGKGVFINKLSNGVEVWEFWNPLIDGTGHVTVMRDGDNYFLSNHYAMLHDVASSISTSARVQRLSDEPQFNQLVNETLPASNLFLWVNPRNLAKTLRAFGERNAVDEVKSRMDWDSVRAVEEQKVINERFPGKRRGQLSPDEQSQVDETLKPLLDEMEETQLRQQVPALRAALERQVEYMELCSEALLTVALDPKAIDVALSAIVPLDK